MSEDRELSYYQKIAAELATKRKDCDVLRYVRDCNAVGLMLSEEETKVFFTLDPNDIRYKDIIDDVLKMELPTLKHTITYSEGLLVLLDTFGIRYDWE